MDDLESYFLKNGPLVNTAQRNEMPQMGSGNMGYKVSPNMPIPLQNTIRRQMPYDISAINPNMTMEYKNHPNFDPPDLALVARNDPNSIYFNPRFNGDINKTFEQLVPHEIEHVLQNRASNRYDRSYDQQVLEEYRKAGGRNSVAKTIENSANDYLLFGALKDKGMTPSPYLGDSGGTYSLREQFADLSGLEQAYKKDLTKDPEVRKRFFNNDQALIDAYKATTGLRTERLDAKDLAPMSVTNQVQGPYRSTEPRSTPQKSYIQILSDLFK